MCRAVTPPTRLSVLLARGWLDSFGGTDGVILIEGVGYLAAKRNFLAFEAA